MSTKENKTAFDLVQESLGRNKKETTNEDTELTVEEQVAKVNAKDPLYNGEVTEEELMPELEENKYIGDDFRDDDFDEDTEDYPSSEYLDSDEEYAEICYVDEDSGKLVEPYRITKTVSRKIISGEINRNISDTSKVKGVKQVDVEKLNIVTGDTLSNDQLFESFINKSVNKKATVEIVATHSGYSCKMVSLTTEDTLKLLNTSHSVGYTNERTLYQIIYSKIVEFSCGHMTFDKWLKNTASYDIENFYFGLYNATFLDETSFKFGCLSKNCEHKTEHTIRTKSLIKCFDYQKVKETNFEILRKSNSHTAREELAVIGNGNILELPDSGVLLEICTPTLFDVLTLHSEISSNDEFKELSPTLLAKSLSVRGMIIRRSDGKYIPFSEREKVFRMLGSLSIVDDKALENVLDKEQDELRTYYAIDKVVCSKCRKELKNVPINFKSILFTLISKNK